MFGGNFDLQLTGGMLAGVGRALISWVVKNARFFDGWEPLGTPGPGASAISQRAKGSLGEDN
jgi:hypothetical protein